MSASIVFIIIVSMICVTLLISQYISARTQQISKNEAKQIREALQKIQDSLVKIESQIADIVIDLHDRKDR
jgi:hypothetical protein